MSYFLWYKIGKKNPQFYLPYLSKILCHIQWNKFYCFLNIIASTDQYKQVRKRFHYGECCTCIHFYFFYCCWIFHYFHAGYNCFTSFSFKQFLEKNPLLNQISFFCDDKYFKGWRKKLVRIAKNLANVHLRKGLT